MIRKIINASAGTGKTFTILEDVLKTALKDKADINDIKQSLKDSVFLSFSKAAVEELKERIHQRLAELTEGGKKKVADEMAGFLGSRVYTLHAFSLELARILRYELGLPAAVDFITDADTTVWKETVSEFYSKEFESESLKKTLGLEAGHEKALFDLMTIAGDKYKIKSFIREKGENVFYVHSLGGQTPEIPDEASVLKLLASIGYNPGKKFDYEKEKTELQTFLYEKRAVIEEFEKDILPMIKELAKKRERLDEGYELKKDGSKCANQIKCEKAIEELEAVVEPFMKKSGVLKIFEVMEAAGGILTKIICHIGDKRYIPAMMEEGLFDFDAIVFLVIRLIKQKGRKWLLERLASEEMALKNLYIDEAQDSDIVQNYLISVLAGGDDKSINVTVVGDVKQSIYQWRNAYPEEFRQMYKEASDAGKSADLKMSWRVNNEENLKLINDMFFRMASNSGSLWDYENSRDELEANPKKIDSSKSKKLRITRMFKDTDVKSLKTQIDAFMAGGSCGILVDKKAYANISGILEILDSVKQRIKIESSRKDGVQGTALPERMLLTSLLNLRLNDRLQYMPYLLLLTTPGNIIRSKARDIKGASDLYELFKKLKYYTESVYDTYRESGIAKSVCSLMDKYGMWKYMFHGTASTPDTLSEASIRRGINSMIAAIHMNEKTGDTAIYSREDVVADTIDADNSPFEWYGLPGSVAKAGDRELTTIHSSKGLQYDNTIIFTDLMGRLKPDTDFSDTEYKYLYHADFEDVLTDLPKVTVSFYPYFGTLPCKVIKQLYNEQKAPWAKGLIHYNKTAEKVISENMNVLYVALTRAKDGIWLVDVSNKTRYGKKPDDASVLADEIGVIAGSEPVDVDLPKKQDAGPPPGETMYYEMTETKKLIEVEEKEEITSVRKLIKDSGRLKVNGSGISPYENFSHIETGTLAHEMVQKTLGVIKGLDGYENGLKEIKPAGETEQKAVDIIKSDATKKELEKLKDIIGSAELRSELPVWHIDESGMLVKGVIDTLAIGRDKASIIEYKTVFDDGKAQKEMSKMQLEMYEKMLTPILKGKKTEKISVMLKK